MRESTRRGGVAAWAAAAASTAPTGAGAYLDPGAAYMGLQWALGAVAGAGAAIALYWRRIVDACRRWRRRPAKAVRSDDPEQADGPER